MADAMQEIYHTLTFGYLKAHPEVPESRFKLQGDVKTVDAEVACRPDPLPELGEASIWDARTKRLLFLDVIGVRLFRLDPAGALEEHDLRGFSTFASSVVPLSESCDPSGDIVGLTLRDCFATYNLRTKRLRRLPGAPVLAEGERFNDGKADTMGRYWAGTIARDAAGEPAPQGALYRRDLDGTVTKVLKDIAISNGLTWTKDGSMYYTDTPTGKLDVMRYDDKSGSVEDRRPCIEGFDFEATGFPDGHCMDAEGMLWVACFNGGMARRFNPKTGALLAEVRVPPEAGRQVTSCAFGGEGLGDLYLTTAHEFMPASELEANGIPLAGALFKVPREKLQAIGAAPGAKVQHWFLPGAGKTPTCCCAGASKCTMM